MWKIKHQYFHIWVTLGKTSFYLTRLNDKKKNKNKNIKCDSYLHFENCLNRDNVFVPLRWEELNFLYRKKWQNRGEGKRNRKERNNEERSDRRHTRKVKQINGEMRKRRKEKKIRWKKLRNRKRERERKGKERVKETKKRKQR